MCVCIHIRSKKRVVIKYISLLKPRRVIFWPFHSTAPFHWHNHCTIPFYIPTSTLYIYPCAKFTMCMSSCSIIPYLRCNNVQFTYVHHAYGLSIGGIHKIMLTESVTPVHTVHLATQGTIKIGPGATFGYVHGCRLTRAILQVRTHIDGTGLHACIVNFARVYIHTEWKMECRMELCNGMVYRGMTLCGLLYFHFPLPATNTTNRANSQGSA